MDLRMGIVGLGIIAERFAAVMKNAKAVALTAVAARDRAKAEAFARRFGAAKACSSYLDLIRDEEVDAVYIALTHNYHYEIARLCLEAGKAVICEKPLVTTKKEAESLAALARSRKLLLMEAMWTRCIPAFRKARQWVGEGKIGAVKLVEAGFCFKAPFEPEGRIFNPKLAGGGLYDAGVYPIEFATGILGENPDRIGGFASIGVTGVDEYASISLGFPSGALASLSCGVTAAAPRDAKVYGSEGSVVLHDFLGARKCERFDPEGRLAESFEEDFADGFIYQIEHFASLRREGKTESGLIPLADSIACAGVFDELRKQWGLR
jgi:predicted dehydrogenase